MIDFIQKQFNCINYSNFETATNTNTGEPGIWTTAEQGIC